MGTYSFLSIHSQVRKTGDNVEISKFINIIRSIIIHHLQNPTRIIYGYHGLKFITYDKDNKIADFLENRFTHHDLFDGKHERRFEAFVQGVIGTETTAP
jgi:hypothetical protein